MDYVATEFLPIADLPAGTADLVRAHVGSDTAWEQLVTQHDDRAAALLAVCGALSRTVLSLKDGRSIWLWLVGLFPHDARAYVDEAGRRSWRTLISYVRATVVVALVDAIGIGVGLTILGTPLVIPLAALVFLGAFIPIIGSFLAGTVAVLVALVSQGPVEALIALAIVIGWFRRRTPVALLCLFVAPFPMIVLQPYGGEMALRVCYFSLPAAVLPP